MTLTFVGAVILTPPKDLAVLPFDYAFAKEMTSIQ
jgi:hypothetical protein